MTEISPSYLVSGKYYKIVCKYYKNRPHLGYDGILYGTFVRTAYIEPDENFAEFKEKYITYDFIDEFQNEMWYNIHNRKYCDETDRIQCDVDMIEYINDCYGRSVVLFTDYKYENSGVYFEDGFDGKLRGAWMRPYGYIFYDSAAAAAPAAAI